MKVKEDVGNNKRLEVDHHGIRRSSGRRKLSGGKGKRKGKDTPSDTSPPDSPRTEGKGKDKGKGKGKTK